MSASADSRPILVPQHYVVLVNYLEREFAAVADALAGTSTPSMPLEGQLAVNAIDRMLGVLAGTAQDFASACNGSLGQAFADGTHLSDGDMRAIARSACEPVLFAGARDCRISRQALCRRLCQAAADFADSRAGSAIWNAGVCTRIGTPDPLSRRRACAHSTGRNHTAIPAAARAGFA